MLYCQFIIVSEIKFFPNNLVDEVSILSCDIMVTYMYYNIILNIMMTFLYVL